jgi:hypothetical protein
MNHHQPDQSQSQHHVHRVVLPSGKTIEVVYFDPAAMPQAPEHPFEHIHGGATELDLSHCPSCDSKLVYPVDWAEANPGYWQVDLRCPNCEWSESGVYSQDVVDRFDMALDVGTEALIGDLQALMRANMEEEIERFVTALAGGHILPEDF